MVTLASLISCLVMNPTPLAERNSSKFSLRSILNRPKNFSGMELAETETAVIEPHFYWNWLSTRKFNVNSHVVMHLNNIVNLKGDSSSDVARNKAKFSPKQKRSSPRSRIFLASDRVQLTNPHFPPGRVPSSTAPLPLHSLRVLWSLLLFPAWTYCGERRRKRGLGRASSSEPYI